MDKLNVSVVTVCFVVVVVDLGGKSAFKGNFYIFLNKSLV